MNKCRITVLKRMFNQDLVNEYSGENLPDKPLTPCPTYYEGQEFIVVNDAAMPEGFCFWAWADIQRDVAAIMYGADIPWMLKKGTLINCCSDGLRPVVFKLERL
jgi:uncharacterized repeat protein (TIGR04076 family)